MSRLEVSIEQVKELMKRGDPIFFLEIRHPGDRDLALMKVRGALRLAEDEVADHLAELPRERTVLLYSTAPDDQPALKAARLLLQEGFGEVRLLVGGFKAYLNAGLPVEE